MKTVFAILREGYAHTPSGRMFFRSTGLTMALMAALVLGSCSKESTQPEIRDSHLKATWGSCDQWATWSNGG
ncbi:MAG: hypothetical protein ACP5PS_10860 [Bacteroidales bacterium]